MNAFFDKFLNDSSYTSNIMHKVNIFNQNQKTTKSLKISTGIRFICNIFVDSFRFKSFVQYLKLIMLVSGPWFCL